MNPDATTITKPWEEIAQTRDSNHPHPCSKVLSIMECTTEAQTLNYISAINGRVNMQSNTNVVSCTLGKKQQKNSFSLTFSKTCPCFYVSAEQVF